MKRTPTVALLAGALLAQPAAAQLTLDQRIKKAAEAQAAKEAVIPVTARPSTGAVTPTVSLAGIEPPRAIAMPQPKLDRFELVQIKGFLDVPNGLEAAILANGVRYVVTVDQPQLADGWRVTSITHDAVELARGSNILQLRFGTAAVAPPQGPEPAARAVSPAAAPAQKHGRPASSVR